MRASSIFAVCGHKVYLFSDSPIDHPEVVHVDGNKYYWTVPEGAGEQFFTNEDGEELTISYGDFLDAVADIIATSGFVGEVNLSLENIRVTNARKNIVVLQESTPSITSSNVKDGNGATSFRSTINLDLFSLDRDCIKHLSFISSCLRSEYSLQQQNKFGFGIFPLPSTVNNVSSVEGSKGVFRYNMTINFCYTRINKYNSNHFETQETQTLIRT